METFHDTQEGDTSRNIPRDTSRNIPRDTPRNIPRDTTRNIPRDTLTKHKDFEPQESCFLGRSWGLLGLPGASWALLVAWTRESTWFQLKTTMLDTPWVAWTRENTRLQLGTTMLDTHLGGLDT